MSRPLQVYIEEEDLARLEAWSRERGWTKSQAVRAAVRALTRPRNADPLLDASGMIDELPPDLSRQFDRYLEETFVAKTTVPGRPAARRTGKRVRR
jgi:hypothetical protein